MKKFLLILVSLIALSGMTFAQDFDSEAEDVSQSSNECYIGFNLSILGVEPAFQWIHNEKMELQGGVFFIQYAEGLLSPDQSVGVITPAIDLGYRTAFYFPNTHFSVGGNLAAPIGIANSNYFVSGALSVYFKASYTVGLFEFSAKTFVPLLEGCYSTMETNFVNTGFKLAFADSSLIAQGLLFTTIEAKIRLP